MIYCVKAKEMHVSFIFWSLWEDLQVILSLISYWKKEENTNAKTTKLKLFALSVSFA